MSGTAHPVENVIARAAVRAVASEPRGGFLLDHPPGATHPRNLSYSWNDSKTAFGMCPSEILRIEPDATGARVVEDLDNLAARMESSQAAIAVGFLSYDLGGALEPACVSARRPDALPLAFFALYDEYLEYDAKTDALTRCLPGGRREPADKRFEQRLRTETADARDAFEQTGPALPNFTPAEYRKAVARATEYILAGDIFEVNLSQRFTAPFGGDVGDLYMFLREYNPAPYAAFLTCPEGAVLSSSPELFLRVRGEHIVTRPIKGTTRRRPGADKDDAAAKALLLSAKDNAELAMIIDLERNDLGRVATYGSVRVSERARVETFAKVHHLVSTIEGRLRQGVTLGALLRAVFPGGSITGAPKVRAMQIIDELEPCRRGVYTGSLGYVIPGGAAEFNIAIRTIVASQGTLALQVGGAVTAESDPQAEYEETLAKAEAMFEALPGGALVQNDS